MLVILWEQVRGFNVPPPHAFAQPTHRSHSRLELGFTSLRLAPAAEAPNSAKARRAWNMEVGMR